MISELIERINAEIEHQRQTRGDILDYGTPDPLLVEAAATIAQLQAELAEARKMKDQLMIAAAATIKGSMDEYKRGYADAAREVPGRIVEWLRNSAKRSSRKRATWKGRLFWIATAIRWPENICAGNALGIATAIEARDWSKP